jgi:hypothetical protein
MKTRRASFLCCFVGLGWACGTQAPSPGPSLATAHQAVSRGAVVWEKQETTMPPARMGHALLYDSVRAVTVAAGGRPVNDGGVSLSDTWSWDGLSWASIAAALPPRGFIAGTFDSGRGISLTYGGVDRPTFTPQFFSQIVERADGAWSLRSGFPGARSTTGLTYDAGRAVTVLFGGFDGHDWHNDIFEWDGTFWRERCTDPPCELVRPSVRENAVFVYDPARQVTLLFGGFGDYEARAETWTWDGSTWTQRLPSVSPSARYGCAAAYDPSTRRILMFGGTTADGDVNELWAWDGSTWEQLEQQSGPTPRRDVRLAWDTTRKRGVLFGGRAGTQAVDFWELSLAGNSCTGDEECHRDLCIDGLCGGPRPTPEVDGGDGGGTGTPQGGAGGAAGHSSDNGGSAGSGSENGGSSTGGEVAEGVPDAGNTTPEAPGSPGATPAPASSTVAAHRTSFYGCAMSAGISSSAWPAGAGWAMLVLRRRAARTARRKRWGPAVEPEQGAPR